MIVFQTLKAQDCFSYTNLEFNFQTGLHSISGMNGSSKTSIFLVLQQCLYNKNAKGCKIEDVNNKITGKPYEIEVTFTKGANAYHIVNSKKKGCIEIYHNGVDISLKRIPDNLKLIEEILECDFQTFCDLTYQSKESTLNLLDSSTNKGRSEFANRTLKLAELDQQLGRMDAYRKELEGKRGTIALLSESLETLKASLSSEACEMAPLPTAELQGRMKVFSELLEDWQGRKVRIEADLGRLQTDLSRSANYAQQMLHLKGKQDELALLSAPDKDLAECRDQLSRIQQAESKRTTMVALWNKELEMLKKAAATGKCHACGHEVEAKQFDVQVTQIQTHIAEANEFLERCKSGGVKYASRINTWEEIHRLEQEIARLTNAVPYECDAEALKQEESRLQYELRQVQDEISGLKAEQQEVQAKYDEAIKHNATVAAVKDLNANIRENNAKLHIQIDQHAQQLADSERRLDLLKSWVGILGPKGYRTVMVNRFLQSLNKTMSTYARLMCDGRIKCLFFINEAGEIDFSITDDAKAMDIVLWSGGETARIKIVCLFAVLELLEVTGATSFNVLCLDEIFDALDQDGKAGLFNVLEYLKGKNKALYTIAHSELALDLVYDSVIAAEKLNDGTTRVFQCTTR
ncbi:AAA family ATPase [Geobacter sp. SVR]|uniref:AAA family ATPase n=1 Tax=Geobacter sp. SVR TaxID=2495594 RepID=UPI00143EFBCD|nr:AAA family ATPase [Geobacter sp. SVR]BCS54084.1 hypothetical protein GSVR_23920 [Geobacter sp. SVR]GCF87567.1 hypothetical protein GSbR_41670 [Geobacter sp. SVR]